MKKRWPKFMILALSLLLLTGVVASASAASSTGNSQTGLLGQGMRAGQQHAQTALKAVSDLTGLSLDDIFSQRVEGKSLSAIAESKGFNEQAVIDKVIAERTAVLDELKADNKITAAEYQACLDNMAERVKSNIEQTTVGRRNVQGKQGMGFMQGQGQGQRMGRGYGQNAANCPYAKTADSN